MTDVGATLREALAAVADDHARPIPPIDRVHAGARKRKRRRAVLSATVMVVVATVAAALVQRAEPSRLEVIDRNEILTPQSARMLPADTLGHSLLSVLDMPSAPNASGHAVTVQLWGDAGRLLGIRTWRSGGTLAGGVDRSEMVPIAGWTDPAEVRTYSSGAVMVALFDDSLLVEVVSRDLDRAQLVAIAERLRVNETGGVTVDPATLPSGWNALAEEPMVLAPSLILSYGQPSREGRNFFDLSARTQTQAGRAFDRLVEPPRSSVDVNGTTIDVVVTSRGHMLSVIWIPAPNVQLQIQMFGIDAGTEEAALQVARSVRRVDEKTWRTALENVVQPIGPPPTTMSASTSR
jgi:hypothetical protein